MKGFKGEDKILHEQYVRAEMFLRFRFIFKFSLGFSDWVFQKFCSAETELLQDQSWV